MEPVTTNRLSERHIVTIVTTHKPLHFDPIKHAQIHAKGLFTCYVFLPVILKVLLHQIEMFTLLR